MILLNKKAHTKKQKFIFVRTEDRFLALPVHSANSSKRSAVSSGKIKDGGQVVLLKPKLRYSVLLYTTKEPF